MERRRLNIITKSFEDFNNNYPELPQISGLVEQDSYLLALPAALEIMGKDIMYKIEAIEQIDSYGCVFHVVANQEDYEYSLYQFLNADRFAIPDAIKVLLFFHDQELGVYTTLALKVRMVPIS